ncbi:hypothetical protein FJB87_02390 [Salmonella enterica subsp. enterica]|uniref:hypothetical protein n=1 Tax=Salmonella enterica TaxID=28901 RepID=UPI0012C2BBEA|nr:hypothetical protein [Salmonella enterica]EBG6922927.1 hypothetical protein [Salmonella enterica subsp. enterica]EBW9496404.1 hypothetical protein [Salmonella enterica subsp. enterica serovar Brandenburg]ECB7382933.1 hypothetical protein [Salmonella enterica subsp. enterica serovar Brandenburg]ECN6005716.1 hypothetical protein [Salmonella enterica subsp. enterica serovar Brandenburg]EIS1578218.1 hypothetical protein [Salmonella enterica subsp. enterica serovar Brandenburg]
MHIPDDMIPGLPEHTGPVLIYFVKGRAERGFALRKDEFVTSLRALEEAKRKTGLPVSDVS